jgi:hypothetical protein
MQHITGIATVDIFYCPATLQTMDQTRVINLRNNFQQARSY